jgi:hypothetical protein
MRVRRCATCRATIPGAARSCPQCGATVRHPLRALAGAVLVLGAAALAAVIYPSWRQARLTQAQSSLPSADRPDGYPASSASPTNSVRTGEWVPSAETRAVAPTLAADEASGFAPPAPGACVDLKLRSGSVLHGTIRELTDRTVTLESGPATITLAREQLDPSSRSELFAVDFRERAAASTARSAESGAAATQATDIADTFFRAFETRPGDKGSQP